MFFMEEVVGGMFVLVGGRGGLVKREEVDFKGWSRGCGLGRRV